MKCLIENEELYPDGVAIQIGNKRATKAQLKTLVDFCNKHNIQLPEEFKE